MALADAILDKTVGKTYLATFAAISEENRKRQELARAIMAMKLKAKTDELNHIAEMERLRQQGVRTDIASQAALSAAQRAAAEEAERQRGIEANEQLTRLLTQTDKDGGDPLAVRLRTPGEVGKKAAMEWLRGVAPIYRTVDVDRRIDSIEKGLSDDAKHASDNEKEKRAVEQWQKEQQLREDAAKRAAEKHAAQKAKGFPAGASSTKAPAGFPDDNSRITLRSGSKTWGELRRTLAMAGPAEYKRLQDEIIEFTGGRDAAGNMRTPMTPEDVKRDRAKGMALRYGDLQGPGYYSTPEWQQKMDEGNAVNWKLPAPSVPAPNKPAPKSGAMTTPVLPTEPGAGVGPEAIIHGDQKKLDPATRRELAGAIAAPLDVSNAQTELGTSDVQPDAWPGDVPATATAPVPAAPAPAPAPAPAAAVAAETPAPTGRTKSQQMRDALLGVTPVTPAGVTPAVAPSPVATPPVTPVAPAPAAAPTQAAPPELPPLPPPPDAQGGASIMSPLGGLAGTDDEFNILALLDRYNNFGGINGLTRPEMIFGMPRTGVYV